ncbi:NADH-quinone oxidoreductase subunit M [Alkalilimnicola ehrlichii]|uniref:NADH-quinone oxidoreductase subunit M n=1 Tax=Alkalilimnicola ehrlichii TaxID=351052 RepID=A0A3E0X0I4_9GAMM|nr:NADH-quinone oxidoreductase subunit M [Alkalilimnicola ehrlichii]RFA30579.1 NADH-quinone oxidoreductase subunit M [Alkalilimnicola ehrlichii]RFA38129.1 NADH-quinone oxidoreductase subunit M [Alkalilimnicola ehrlichii]
MFDAWPLLSLLIWLPIAGGVLVLAVGGKQPERARYLALLVSVLVFLLSLPLFAGFSTETAAMQFVERVDWVPALGVEYYLGVDGISMPLIILTAFSTILVVLASWRVIQYKPAQYLAAFLIMEGIMIGVFSALDAILFYVFWEAMLVPMFLVIGIWGGPNRIYATVKFFLYTFLGSVLMLVALIYLQFQAESFDILEMHQLALPFAAQIWVFLAFLLAFAVKVPMWPVHTWLPDAHVEAPTGGSVILAAIMLKIGGYGFLRFALPITPEASMSLAWLVIALSLVAVVYIGLVAMVQEDMKKLIAYSSIAHMGFVTLGFFLIFPIAAQTGGSNGAALLALEGGMVQMISHGFISAAMFLCVGVLYDRMHSRRISDYGGVANKMPVFAAFFVLFAMANAGLPGTSGFVGEFMVILAAFQANFWYAFLAGMTLVLGAAYSLWLIKRVVYGEVANDKVAALEDVTIREKLILGILAIAVLALGLWPAPLIEVMEPTLANLLEQVMVAR